MNKVLDVLAYIVILASILAVVLVLGMASVMTISEFPRMSLGFISVISFSLVFTWAVERLWPN